MLHLAGRPHEAAEAVREATRLYEQKGNIAAAANLRARLAQPRIAV